MLAVRASGFRNPSPAPEPDIPMRSYRVIRQKRVKGGLYGSCGIALARVEIEANHSNPELAKMSFRPCSERLSEIGIFS